MKPPDQKGLTAERLREVLHYDPLTGVFTRLAGASVGTAAGGLNGRGYSKLRVDGNRHAAHRLAWLYVHGKWPAEYIDHINGVRDDNRIANLREASLSANARNRTKVQPQSKTGVMGVHRVRHTGKFSAYMSRDNKQIYLGCYATTDEASAVRAAAIAEYERNQT